MRYALIVLSLLVLLPADVGAKRHFNARWDHRTPIIVENRAGPEWNDGVEFVVGAWHRAFPRLRYKVIHHPRQKKCGTVPGRIVICAAPLNNHFGGYTWDTRDGREIVSANIRIVRTGAGKVIEGQAMGIWNDHLSMLDMFNLCHEFGHAIGLAHYLQWRDSCLGALTPKVYTPIEETEIRPGQFDRNSLKILYRRKGPGWP